jgi:parvulin-like peptidyl-prolyl isomerase
MRILAIPLLLAALAQPAWAQQQPTVADPTAVPNAERSFESERLMKLQDIQKKLEQAGFKDVEIIPEAVLVRAKKDDKSVMMIIDAETMTAIQLTGPSPSETTGSGSSDDAGHWRR